jgi:hypothetical protein
LRGHHGLATARGAPFEIRVLESARVTRVEELLGLGRRFVDRAVSEIHDFFGMTITENGAVAVGDGVAGIGARRRVTGTQCRLHVAVPLDRPREPAVADDEQSTIPVLGGEPEFGVDVRVRGRRQRHADAAVRRQRCRGAAAAAKAAAAASRKRSRGNALRRHLSALQCERGERLAARALRSRLGRGGRGCDSHGD